MQHHNKLCVALLQERNKARREAGIGPDCYFHNTFFLYILLLLSSVSAHLSLGLHLHVKSDTSLHQASAADAVFKLCHRHKR